MKKIYVVLNNINYFDKNVKSEFFVDAMGGLNSAIKYVENLGFVKDPGINEKDLDQSDTVWVSKSVYDETSGQEEWYSIEEYELNDFLESVASLGYQKRMTL